MADIDDVIARVTKLLPPVEIRQHRATHPGDDDGVWFFTSRGREIQVESSTHDCPFIVEHDDMASSADAIAAATVDEVVRAVVEYLGSG